MSNLYKLFAVDPADGQRKLYAECSYPETLVLCLDEAKATGWTSFFVKSYLVPGGDGQNRLITSFPMA